MHIAIVHTRYRNAGGEDVAVTRLGAALQSAGHRVSAITAENPVDNFSTARSLIHAPSNRSAVGNVLSQLRSVSPDVVHVHNTWFAISPLVLKEISDAGLPLVVTLHNYRFVCSNGLLLREGKECTKCVNSTPLHGIYQACYRNSRLLSIVGAATIAKAKRTDFWGSADRVIVHHESINQVAQQVGFDPKKIRLIPHFVSDPGPRVQSPSQSKNLLYVGRLSSEKGVDLLLEAFARLKTEQMSLTLYGDGPLQNALQARATGRVHFAGAVSHETICQAMLRARALIVPSTCRETGPLCAIEALSAGLPIIMSDAVTMSGDLSQNGSATAFNSGSSVALYDALVALGATFLDTMGRQARTWFVRHHQEKDVLKLFEETYQEAVAKRVTQR